MSDTSSRPFDRTSPSPARLALGFVAGFVAVLIFHQGMLAILYAVDFARAGPFPMSATWPVGIPKIWSLAFWGGVWGILFVLAERFFPRGAGYWLGALLFGAIGPTLVAWFVVSPIRGNPVAGDWQIAAMNRGLILNGAWGLGTGFLLWVFARAKRASA